MRNSLVGAVDVGGTKIAVGLVDSSGKVIDRQDLKSDPDMPFENTMDLIAEILIRQTSESNRILEGIGIGCTGQIDSTNQIIQSNAFLPNWSGYSPSVALSTRINVPCVIENDADAAALAEYFWGNGADSSRFLYITISTGVGGGFILDGKVYRGAANQHPEFGHHTISMEGPQCFCGARGCWETFASGRALEKRWFQKYHTQFTAAQIAEQAEQGSQHAIDMFNQQGYWIGLGLSNLISIFSPDKIALGGGVSRSFGLLKKQLLLTVQDHCKLISNSALEIVPASLEPHTGLLGAARAFFQHLSLL